MYNKLSKREFAVVAAGVGFGAMLRYLAIDSGAGIGILARLWPPWGVICRMEGGVRPEGYGPTGPVLAWLGSGRLGLGGQGGSATMWTCRAGWRAIPFRKGGCSDLLL